MIDKKIRPVYDVQGHYLQKEIVRGWVLALMEPEQWYSRQDLIDRVEAAHQASGGLDGPINEAQQHGRIQDALLFLEEHKYVASDGKGWRLLRGLDALPTFRQIVMDAEGKIGEGQQQAVYGWYLPAYCELAELKGKHRFPMKVGRTHLAPQDRMNTHIGTAPEKPVLGFVLSAHEEAEWEFWIHENLKVRGQHLTEALGREWFLTNPEELRRLVVDELADYRAAARAPESGLSWDAERPLIDWRASASAWVSVRNKKET